MMMIRSYIILIILLIFYNINYSNSVTNKNENVEEGPISWAREVLDITKYYKVERTFKETKLTKQRRNSFVNHKLRRYIYYSMLAYCRPLKKLEKETSKCDCKFPKDYKFNSKILPTNIQVCDNADRHNRAYIAINSNYKEIILAFRGTEVKNDLEKTRLRNIFQDISAFAENNALKHIPSMPKGAVVHKGFLNSYMNIRDCVRSKISALRKKYPSYKIGITGHSLGGATATVCASDFIGTNFVKPAQLQLITLGSPRVANKVAAEWLNRKLRVHKSDMFNSLSYRLVNGNDPVPHLPRGRSSALSPGLFARYHHIGREVWIYGKKIMICSKKNEEDPLCSRAVNGGWNVNDHSGYLNMCPK